MKRVVGRLIMVVLGLIGSLFALHVFTKPADLDPQFSSPYFPDNELCSLGCGSDWATFTNFNERFTVLGWHAKKGDVVRWVINDDRGSRLRGFYIVDDGIVAVTMRLNGKELHVEESRNWNDVLKCNMHHFNLGASHDISDGDVIDVEVLSTMGDGFVKSMQPNGGH